MTEEKEKPLTREDVLRLIQENGGTARGLDLSNAEFEAGIDLRDLNLQGIILFKAIFRCTTLTELAKKGVVLEDAERSFPESVGSRLARAHLEGARLSYAQLEDARLPGTHLEGATLLEAHFEGAYLENAHFEDVDGWNVHFEGADLSSAHLERTHLNNAHFEGACLLDAHLEKASLKNADFKGAGLSEAHLEDANLAYAHLEEADLWGTHFEGAYLSLLEFSANIDLKGIDWGNYVMGEEKKGDFGSAEGVYRHLKLWHTNAGMYEIAAEFYYREMEAKRRQLRWWTPSLSLGSAIRFIGSYVVMARGLGKSL